MDWALSHPDRPVQKTALARLGKRNAVFHFRTGPAAGCSQATSWSRLRPHRWMMERFAPSQVIKARRSVLSVLNSNSGKHAVGETLHRTLLSLTTPSSL